MNDKKIGFCHSSWGDAIIHLGYIQAMREEAGPIIYYGNDYRIAKFIENQSACTFVIHIKPNLHSKHHDFLTGSFGDEKTFKLALQAYSFQYNFSPDDVLMSFPKSYYFNDVDEKMPIARNLRPSLLAAQWADSLEIKTPFVIVQPFSINTNSLSQHWPHWYCFMRSIFSAEPNINFVLMGRGWPIEKIESHNVIDLTKSTLSVDYMYALADKANGVISTSNSLAHYCVSNKIPLMVCASFYTGTHGRIFSRVLRSENTLYVGYTDSVYSAMLKFDQLSKIAISV